MPTDTFSRSLTTTRSPAECWARLTDVNRVASWIPIVRDVRTIALLERYEALLEDRVGPFRLRADLDVEVVEAIENESIAFRAAGQDRQVGSRLAVEARMSLHPTGGGTRVELAGTYAVEGRVATLGGSVIRHKADVLLTQFADAAARDLAA